MTTRPTTGATTGPKAGPPAGAAAPRRLSDVDALRGFALWGTQLVNITFMASAYRGTGVDDPAFGSALDTAVPAS